MSTRQDCTSQVGEAGCVSTRQDYLRESVERSMDRDLYVLAKVVMAELGAAVLLKDIEFGTTWKAGLPSVEVRELTLRRKGFGTVAIECPLSRGYDAFWR